MQILVNHMGYSAHGPKKAVVQCRHGETPKQFSVQDAAGSEVLARHPAVRWYRGQLATGSYYTAIFDELEAEGRYCVVVDDVRSDCFEIRAA